MFYKRGDINQCSLIKELGLLKALPASIGMATVVNYSLAEKLNVKFRVIQNKLWLTW